MTTVTINGVTVTEGVEWIDRPTWSNDVATPLISRSTWSIDDNIGPAGITTNTTLADSLPNFSVSFWVKSSSSAWQLIKTAEPQVGLATPTLPGWHTEFVSNVMNIWFVTDSSNYTSLQSSLTINDGNWHNLIITWNGTNILLYVDGILDPNTSSGVGTVSVYSNAVPFQFYGSQFDEMRMFSTVLSQADATAIAAGGNPIGATAIAYWTMEEGAGVILHDSVGANTIAFGSNAYTATTIAHALNNNGIISGLLSASAVSGTVNLTANLFGPSGNSITLAVSDNVNMGVSGPTMSGGGVNTLPPGLTIYNLDSNTMNYWNGSVWSSF